MSERLYPIKLENYRPLREIVFESIRDAIVSGRLRPGERLMEVQLADELGVSRTPVREAIRKLELEGFVVMIPRKGAYVADISTKDIADVYEIRVALDGLAAGLAAERITDEELDELGRLLVQVAECAEQTDLDRLVEVDTQFHDVLYRASRNQRLVVMIQSLREQIQRLRRTSMGTPGRMRQTLAEHKKIVDAISERDVVMAQQLAQDHIENARHRILEAISRSGGSVNREQP